MKKSLFVFVWPSDDEPVMVVRADSLEDAVNHYVTKNTSDDDDEDASYVESILEGDSEIRVYSIDEDTVEVV
jgi:hypothetical protein